MFRLIFFIILLSGIGYFIYKNNLIAKFQEYVTLKHEVKLTSSAFTDNSPIPQIYTCDGQAINPPLHIDGVVGNAQSLVLIVTDPDAIGTWIHWVLFNISPNTSDIAEKSIPQGAIQGKSSGGTIGYEPPCPPSGSHHYIFTLYAIDTSLSLQEGSTQKQVDDAIQNHILDKTQLTGLYSRN